jgi:hypothetical protein
VVLALILLFWNDERIQGFMPGTRFNPSTLYCVSYGERLPWLDFLLLFGLEGKAILYPA